MKQEITSYLSIIKKEINELSKFLYDNPEEIFKENKAQTYISKLLLNKDFKVKQNYMDIPTAFCAQFNEGHPKICFLCEYGGDIEKGNIYGNNIFTSISIAAALSLANVISKIYGSVIIIGTPDGLNGSSKTTLQHQGAFEDIDVILISKPYICSQEVALAELSSDKIKLSPTLNRLFAHNLKECGIREIETCKSISLGSSLEFICGSIPCLNSYISIVKDKTITYPSLEFAKETLSDYAQNIAFKTAEALAFTGLDLIEKQNLITEAKSELIM